MMDVPSNIDDYITQFDDVDIHNGSVTVTIAQCECGKTWIIKINDVFKYDSDDYYKIITDHFVGGQHERQVKTNNGE